MNEANNRDSEFLGYEYKELSVEQSRVSMYLDGYKNFGWIADDNFDLPKAGSMVTLHLKRNRKIMNKMELTRLQRNFEACMNEIETLERSKTANARIASLTAGVLGTAFMAGSTFAAVASPPIIWLCILLAVPGFSEKSAHILPCKFPYFPPVWFISPGNEPSGHACMSIWRCCVPAAHG